MIFMIRQIGRGVVRHKWKSILSALIGVLTALLLNIYAGNMESTGRQLAGLPEVMQVQAKAGGAVFLFTLSAALSGI